MAQYVSKSERDFKVHMSELYIGLMSGTSADGVDAALLDFQFEKPALLATHYLPYSDELRKKIFALCEPGDNEIMRLGELDVVLAKIFADAVKELLQKENFKSDAIKAIGSHGQTIRHHPKHLQPFTIQIGDPNTIAAETGITTIADFRRKDLAHGGQGAPLVPAFHHYFMPKDNVDRAIVNIGGIANASILTKNLEKSVVGFDTGPGNILLDSWILLHQSFMHDEKGAWGASGKIHDQLLSTLLSDNYFSLSAPKSTGREYFNLSWLNLYLQKYKTISAIDVQTTLVELTAQTILHSIKQYFSSGEILICGGGAHNEFLMTRLNENAAPYFSVATTEKYGMHPDWMEAAAFAWLAYQTMNLQPGNLPSVTGAKSTAILGGIYHK